MIEYLSEGKEERVAILIGGASSGYYNYRNFFICHPTLLKQDHSFLGLNLLESPQWKIQLGFLK